MDFGLIVVRPFGTHAKGDVIGDAGEIDRILRTEQARHVVRIALPRPADAQQKPEA